jgi:hypothetical protein
MRSPDKQLTPTQIKYIREDYTGAMGQYISYSRMFNVSLLQVKNALGELHIPRAPRMGKNTSVPHRGIAQKKNPKENKNNKVNKARLLKTKIELTLLKQQLEISAKKHPLRVSQLVTDATQLVHRYTTLLERAKNILKIAQDLDGKNA